MLQVYYGNDEIKVRLEGNVQLARLSGATYEIARLSDEEYAPGFLLHYCTASSLFGPKFAYFIDVLTVSSDFYQEFLDEASALASSETIFVAVASSLNADEKKRLQKAGAELTEFKKTAEDKFNIFQMTDALAAKDKRTLWLLLCEAKTSGLSSEEVIGVLWWQLKSLRLASLTKSAEEAGMKDYPYKKARSALKHFRPFEIEELSLSLLSLYHDARRGKGELDLSLERWVLSL